MIPTSAVLDEEHGLPPSDVALTREETPLSIRVRYCGGCNPEIDRGSLVNQLQRIVREAGVEAVFCGDREADWLLLISGCPRACLEEELSEVSAAQQCVSIEGAHMDHRPVPEPALAQAIWERMNLSCGRV